MTEETRNELDLAEARALPFSINKRSVVWKFRTISQKDWQKYFRGIRNQTEQRGDRRVRIFDSETALVELVLASVQSVEGYGDATGHEWKQRLSLAHSLAMGRVLRSVGPSDPDPEDLPTLDELAEVSLDAIWSMDSPGHVAMFRKLLHRFRRPTIEQLKRWNLEISRTVITGNGDYQVTSFPARQLIAMKLYDEMIAEVEGYAFKGETLAGAAPEKIAEVMDGAHKAAAVIELFAGDRESLSMNNGSEFGEDTSTAVGEDE